MCFFLVDDQLFKLVVPDVDRVFPLVFRFTSTPTGIGYIKPVVKSQKSTRTEKKEKTVLSWVSLNINGLRIPNGIGYLWITSVTYLYTVVVGVVIFWLMIRCLNLLYSNIFSRFSFVITSLSNGCFSFSMAFILFSITG